MGVWSLPEVAALVADAASSSVRGILMRSCGRGKGYEILRQAEAADADLAVAAGKVLALLEAGKSVWVLLGMNLENGSVFETVLPDAAETELSGALEFEATHQVLMMPADAKIQFVKAGLPDDENLQRVRGYVFSGKALEELDAWVGKMHRKIDALVYPLLALPDTLPDNARCSFPELEKDFYWQNGMWHAFDGQTSSGDCNRELLKLLRQNCSWAGTDDAEWNRNLTAIMLARFGLQKWWSKSQKMTGLNVLPAYLRPARFRTQLRVMMVLVGVLAVLWGIRLIGSLSISYQAYSALHSQISEVTARVDKMRKKLKSGEKEMKEITKIAEYEVGDRNVVGYLGMLSEKLPDTVLVSSFRWSEGTLDLMLQTQEADLDMVSFFNRVSGVKVVSGSQRTNNNNNVTMANIKLSVNDAKSKNGTAKKVGK